MFKTATNTNAHRSLSFKCLNETTSICFCLIFLLKIEFKSSCKIISADCQKEFICL